MKHVFQVDMLYLFVQCISTSVTFFMMFSFSFPTVFHKCHCGHWQSELERKMKVPVASSVWGGPDTVG